MNRYTIYCTEQQTKKALELGAPIEILPNYTEYKGFPLVKCKDGNDRPCIIPTVEQMINWLEEQGVYFEIGYMQYFHVEGGKDIFDKLAHEYRIRIIDKTQLVSKESDFTSRQEDTLAAIDAALDYLTNNKK